jgi:AcrR family transcriptional regulator
MSAPARPRLAAAERRDALVDAALRVFGDGSYHGTTTAELARAAGVSEPVLYRHFASKRDLYLACIEESWRHLRAVWEEALEHDAPDQAFPAMARVVMCGKEAKSLMTELWMQAVVEAGDDVEVQRFLRRHMREVQQYVAQVIRTGQESGSINRDRDPDAEAWIFISASLLGTIGRRLGLLTEDDFSRIRDARRAWMTGPAG